MTIQRRIIRRTYNGFERYIVQWNMNLFWCIPIWMDNPCFHVGNNYIDKYDDWGYFEMEGAQECMRICNGQEYVGEEVVK